MVALEYELVISWYPDTKKAEKSTEGSSTKFPMVAKVSAKHGAVNRGPTSPYPICTAMNAGNTFALKKQATPNQVGDLLVLVTSQCRIYPTE